MADPSSKPGSQPATDEPKDNADSKGLQDGAGGSFADRLAALTQRLGLRVPHPPPVSRAITEAHQRMHDPAALRESARRLNAVGCASRSIRQTAKQLAELKEQLAETVN